MDDILKSIATDEGLIPDWREVNPHDAYHAVKFAEAMNVPNMGAEEVTAIIGILSEWKKAISNPVEPCHGMEIPKSIIFPNDDLRYDKEVLGTMLRDAEGILDVCAV